MPLDFPPPVPLRRRVDGWTPERQHAFLVALAETGSVTRAARAVGISRASAYRLRDRVDAGPFMATWSATLTIKVPRRRTGKFA